MGNSTSSKYHQLINYKLLSKDGYYINSEISSTKAYSVLIFYNHGDRNPECLNQLEFRTISVDRRSDKIDTHKNYLGVVVWFTLLKPRTKHEFHSSYDNSNNIIYPKLIIREESQIDGNSLEEKYNNITRDVESIKHELNNYVIGHGAVANCFRIESNRFDWNSWQLFWKWSNPKDKYDYTCDSGLFTACCMQKKLIYGVVSTWIKEIRSEYNYVSTERVYNLSQFTEIPYHFCYNKIILNETSNSRFF